MRHFFAGSSIHRAYVMLAASGPMTGSELKAACELPTRMHMPSLFQQSLRFGFVVHQKDGKWAVGDKIPRVVDRRQRTQRVAMREVPIEVPAIRGSLRTLMDVGSNVATGDPLRAIANAMDAARAVLTAPRERFKGAEIELLVAREIRSITLAAQLATATLQQALEVLQ